MPEELKEFRLVVSSVQTLHMSIDEIEEKFNMGQLIMISIMQKISWDEDEISSKKNRGRRPVNVGKTTEKRNLDAFRRL